MTRHHTHRNRLRPLALSMLLLGGGMILMNGCGGEDRAMALVEETKALENTSNKLGNSINAIASSLPAFQEDRPPIMQANLDVFWMNVTSTRLGLGRFQREIDASPELVDKARNLWVGRIQDRLQQAETAGAFSADGQVALRLGEAFGKERVVEELQKILNLKNQIMTRLSIGSDTSDSGS